MNIALVWDDENSRGDWQVTGGRTTTGSLLVSAALISMFTDRVEQPADPSGNPHGWWHDWFEGTPIGSRLYQLRRRKIANRQLLINEATAMLVEAFAWWTETGLASSVSILVTSAAASAVGNSSGNLLRFQVTIAQPNALPTFLSALWSAV